MSKYFIFDVHLDLSLNAMEWNRNLLWSVDEIRQAEKGLSDKPGRGNGTVSLPALREGNIGLVVSTQIARHVLPGSKIPGWYSQDMAWAQTQGQLAWYRIMEEASELVQITDADSLESHIKLWNTNRDSCPIGYILSLEGADSLVSIDKLAHAYHQGLRAVGPAHYGPGVYAQGTDATGGLTRKGRDLLKEMEKLNLILDITHLSDEGFFEAIELYKGPIWASHHNCRELVPHQRQLADEQIKILVEREAVIGMSLDAWMMVPEWKRGMTTPKEKNLTLDVIIDHIDHICQIAGNAHHVGIGSDLDGGFGKEQCPCDIETITDLQKIPTLLQHRGYSENDIEHILSNNFINFLCRIWK